MATTRLTAGSASVNNALSENPASFNTWGAFILGLDGAQSSIDYNQPISTDSSNNLFISAEVTAKGFLGKFSPAGVFVKQVRSEASGRFGAVATDASGNVYVTKTHVTNSDGTAIVKFDNNLNQIWQVSYKWNTSNWSGMKIKIDSSGNPFIVGNSNEDWWVMKLNPANGALTASYKFNNATDYHYSMDVDSAGSVLMGGQASNIGFYGATVLKATNTTTVAWQRHIQGTGSYPSGYVFDIKTDSSNNVYITGTVDATATIQKAFLIKLNSSGNQIWKRTMYQPSGTNRYAQGYKIDLDSSDNIYVTGRTYATGTQARAFLMKFDSSGTLQYQRIIANADSSMTLEASSLKLDSTGNNLYMCYNLYIGSSVQTVAVIKIPSDGSKTGTLSVSGINICTISAGSMTVDDSTDVTVITPSSASTSSTATPASTKTLYLYPFPSSVVTVATV
jgi:hypothetical protein